MARSRINDLKVLLSLVMHPVTKEELRQLMYEPVVQQAFPCFADGNLLALLSESDPAVFPEAGIHMDPWYLKDPAERESLARARILASPALRIAIRQRIAWQASQNELQGMQRDLRNDFYAGDATGVQENLRLLCRYHIMDGGAADAFRFLIHSDAESWLAKLPKELTEIAACFYLPIAAVNFIPATTFGAPILAHPKKFSDNARLALTDLKLLQGDLPSAQKLLKDMQTSAAKDLRTAWMNYLRGENKEAIKTYEAVLQTARKASKQENFTFQSLPGLFYLFALLRDGRALSLLKAQEYATHALEMPHLGKMCFALVNFLIEHLSGKPDEQKISPGTLPSSPLADFLCVLLESWSESAEIDRLSSLADETIRCAGLGFPWITREARNLQALLQGREIDTVTLPGLTGICDCVRTPPLWERTLEKVAQALLKPKGDPGDRLIWECSLDNHSDCPVILHPLEQRRSKNGRWCKGRIFPLKALTDAKTLPGFLTPQDILLCSILANPEMSEICPGNGFRSLAALKILADHPQLYWHGENKAHLTCTCSIPTLNITRQGEYLLLTIQPEYKGNNLIPVCNAQADLQIFQFSPQQIEISSQLGEHLAIPHLQRNKLLPMLPRLAESFTILSEEILDFPSIPQITSDLTPHLRLQPQDQKMTVDLYFKPFPELPNLYLPAQGPQSFLTMRDGRLLQIQRDFTKEKEQQNFILEKCSVLPRNQNGCTWTLDSLELCCNFSLELQEIADKVQIHWPENERLKLSRRITLNDVSVCCRPTGDWLAVDGEVKIDDTTVLSLKEVLQAARIDKGKFIRLEGNQILALSDTFRQRLDDLLAVTTNNENGDMLFNQFAVPFLCSLLQGTDGNDASLEERAKHIEETMTLQPAVPEGLKATLRPYQMEGYTWLSRLYAWGGAGACLADDMGLGKTLQAITLLLAQAKNGPSIVVAPTSVCENWREECNCFAPALKVIVFGGTSRRKMLSNLHAGDVVICSYGLLQSEDDAFQRIQWNIAVLDEAQAIKNHHTKRAKAAVNLKAGFRMVTTGTPIENNLNELWSIFHFVTPGLLGTREEFNANFTIPIQQNNNQRALERLSSIVHPFILRRQKRHVLSDLPEKTEVQLQVELSEEERTFYEALRQNLLNEIRSQNFTQTKMRIKVIDAITKLRQAACNPRLLQPTSSIPSSKLQAFTELLENLLAAGHRILVFSQFVKHLNLIRPELDQRKIAYQYLDGTTSIPDRTAAIKAFQNGEGNVFLISLKAGGLGLNLTKADYVIHMDPWWNPAVEDQASDRAHRIGQKNPVTIYRLIAQNTIETKILNLHQKKRDLADNILSNTNTIEKISPEELLKILAE